ncbi:OmpH family outer membrane protein, partial [Candidatus Omnitrophota bacterium]
FTKERDKKVAAIKQLQDKMNLLSEKQKEAERGELEEKVRALQDYDREKQTDLRKEFNEKRTEILKDIDKVIKNYCKKEGFTLVFNEAGVVYNIKSLDITDKILEILNKKR